MRQGVSRMLKLLKLTAISGAGLLLASGAATATPVPAGTLNIAVLGTPTVNNTAGTVTFGTLDAFFNGLGAFSGYSGSSVLSNTTLSFGETAGALVDYTTTPVPN